MEFIACRSEPRRWSLEAGDWPNSISIIFNSPVASTCKYTGKNSLVKQPRPNGDRKRHMKDQSSHLERQPPCCVRVTEPRVTG